LPRSGDEQRIRTCRWKIGSARTSFAASPLTRLAARLFPSDVVTRQDR
jgi:hypothetical protein